MFLPKSVKLSENSTKTLQYIKSKTGLSLNYTSRIAMLLAMNSTGDIKDSGATNTTKGQDLKKEILFGENEEVYEALLKQFMYDNEIDMPVNKLIVSLIDLGAHKMKHIKKIEQLCSLS